jgi:hypothetical protein
VVEAHLRSGAVASRSPRAIRTAGSLKRPRALGARLDIAVARGLLLDLLATGDTAGVDAAMAAYLDAHGWR